MKIENGLQFWNIQMDQQIMLLELITKGRLFKIIQKIIQLS